MKKLAFILILICVFPGQSRPETGDGYVPHEILVKFVSGTPVSERENLLHSLGADRLRVVKSIGIEHWSLPENISVTEAVDFLEGFESVEKAEPNYLYTPQVFPNDSSFDRLWHLSNHGQTIHGQTGTPGADIAAEQAWDIEQGSRDTVIAVIDSGVAFDHPDLIDNVWTNAAEVPDNNIDDDGNGYVDDVHGWDFVNSDNLPLDYSKDLLTDGHGTHVAGIIAAAGNNGRGVTGVMWEARVMPLQIFDLFQVDTFEAAVIQHIRIISAIEYAVDNGARIINCSFGGSSATEFMRDIIEYANDNQVLVVAAAGNFSGNNDDAPLYPASYDLPNVIAVAATDQNDDLAGYSNFGEASVDLAAPGGSNLVPNIYSTTPPERITLFEDDFESGGEQWVTASVQEDWFIAYDSYLDSSVLRSTSSYYGNDENSYAETYHKIDAADCRGIHLQFDLAYFLEDGYDHLYVERSSDGTGYTVIDRLTGYSGMNLFRKWESEADFGEFYLRFRLNSDYSMVDQGVFVDNVLVTGVPWSYDGSEYNYKTGTSMAAPVVSGVAGLVWSRNPTLSHLQVKDILLENVDILPGLEGRVFSAGRVNAYKALLAAGNNRLYFPHIAVNSLWETTICLVNTSSESLQGIVEAYDLHGEKVAPDMHINMSARMRTEIDIAGQYRDAGAIAYLVFKGDSSDVVGYARYSREGKYRAAIPAAATPSSGDLYLPRIASGNSWWTGVALLNTTSQARTVSFEFDNGLAGSITLNGGEKRAFPIRALAGEFDLADLGAATFKEADGLTGLALLGNPQQLSGMILTANKAAQLYYPHLADPEKWRTDFHLYDPEGLGGSLSLHSYSKSGEALPPVQISTGGSRHFMAAVDELNLSPETAWFRIESSSPFTGADFLGNREETVLAGGSSVSAGKTSGVFPGFEDSGWTGLVLVNLEDSLSLVDLTAYNDSGDIIAASTVELAPFAKMVGRVEDLFEGDTSRASYAVYNSNTELVGFQLNGSRDGRLLDSLQVL